MLNIFMSMGTLTRCSTQKIKASGKIVRKRAGGCGVGWFAGTRHTILASPKYKLPT
jgi:hypothetical protein